MRAFLPLYIIISTIAFIVSGLHAETHESDTATGILSDTVSEKPVKQQDATTVKTPESNTERNIVPIEQVKDLFTLMVESFKQEYPQSVAVFPFDSSFQGRMIGEIAVNFYSDNTNFWVVKKDTYLSVMKNIPAIGNYQDMDQIINAGTDMEVTFCVAGSLQRTESDYIIAAKMIQVEEKRIIAQVTARMDIKQFDTHIKKTCYVSDKKTIPYYASFQSRLIPGLGQLYYGYKTRGFIFVGLTAVGVGGTIYLATKYKERQETLQLYKEHDLSTVQDGQSPSEWVAMADDAQEKRNTAATRLNIAFAGLGALWLYNMIDAFIIDKKIQKKIPAVYFSFTPGLNTNLPDRAYLSVTLRF